jgi:hypothetical protein
MDDEQEQLPPPPLKTSQSVRRYFKQLFYLGPEKTEVSRAVRLHFRRLSHRGAAAIKGTEAAKERSRKAVAGRQRKRAERRAAAEKAAR